MAEQILNPIALDFNDLALYDKKIKEYIDEKADLITASIPDTYSKDEIDSKIASAYKAELKDIDARIDVIAEQVASNTANIISHREELDDIEHRILTLEGDDKLITKEISELKVAIENKANKEKPKFKEIFKVILFDKSSSAPLINFVKIII